MTADATPLIRTMTADDMDLAETMTAAVGWPHRAADWRFVHALGFGLVAEAGGAVLGTAMGWRFGAEAGALGMIIIAPDAQGRGLGRRLTAAIMESLGDRAIHLHATQAGLPLYEKLGFRQTGMVRQHQGIARAVAAVAGPTIRAAGAEDLAAVCALDRAATGRDRSAAIASLFAVGEVVLLEQGGPVGFAVLRRFGRGQLIGPVVAPDAAGAQALIAHFVAQHPGSFLRIDAEEASGLCPWLADCGLADAGGAIPMLRGAAPETGAKTGAVRRFALINQALG